MHDIHLPTFEFTVPDTVDYPEQVPAQVETEIRLLRLTFPDIPLWPRHIPQWRGAVVEQAAAMHGSLKIADIFHNHAPEGDATLHRPALIQYRSSSGKAVLWGMNEGADAIHQWYAALPQQIEVDRRFFPTGKVEMMRGVFPLTVSSDWQYYRIHDYLVLNAENYHRWLQERSLIARAAIIESALTGHLLRFCSGAGFRLTDRLNAQLVEIHSYQQIKYHSAPLLSFDLTYRTNLQIPDEVALGKAVSHGFGVQRKVPKF